jgi:acyl-CoA synthetase (AMP-forming)/AMP-acid ligase II
MFAVFAHPHELFHRSLLLGGDFVILDSASPRVVAEAIARHGVRWVMAVPSFYEMLLDHLRETGASLPGLRVLEAGGAHVSPEALARMDAHDTPHGRRMAARLRSPSANLSTIQRLVETAAVSLDLGATPALRLRVGCTDTPSAFQAAVVLQAWRARRAAGEDAAAAAFARAHVQRGATRVELAFPGTVEQVLRLVAAPSS